MDKEHILSFSSAYIDLEVFELVNVLAGRGGIVLKYIPRTGKALRNILHKNSHSFQLFPAFIQHLLNGGLKLI